MELIDKLNELIKSYNYQSNVNFRSLYMLVKYLIDYNKGYINYKEVAELLLLLKLCKGSEIRISGTIKTQSERYVKGTNITITIKYEIFQSILENMLNTYLINKREHLYINDIGLNQKEYTILQDGDKSNYKALLNEEELNSIVEYESDFLVLPRNASEGMLLWTMVNNLLEDITDHKKVKEYSFVYDILVLVNKVNYAGEGYNGTIGKEKYDYVKNRIKAWEVANKRHNII